jgi:Uma2 family endonuclease
MDAPISQKIAFYTIEEFFEIYGEKDERYELIDGIPYMMAAPNTDHQALSMFLSIEIGNFLKGKKCRVFAAPYDVFLSESKKSESGIFSKIRKIRGTVVQPDLIVVCDPDKIKPDGCHGAPDLVVEIISESTKTKDESLKLYKYFSSGVKEYWLIDPKEQTVQLYHKQKAAGNKATVDMLDFGGTIKSRVLDGLEIDLAQFAE